MKRLVLGIALLVLTIWNAGLAQVTPEAQKLLNQAVQAHGGRAAIEGLRTLTQTGTDRFTESEGVWLEAGYRRILDFSGRQFRFEGFRNGFIDTVWQFTSGAGVKWTAKDGLQKTRSTNDAVNFFELKVLLAPMYSASALGARTVLGMTGQAVRVTLNTPGLDTFTYLFAGDGIVLARAYGSDINADAEIDVFGDYREVAGLRLSYWYRYFENGKLDYEEKAFELRTNTDLNAEMFKLPPPASPPANIGATLETMPGVGIKVTGVASSGPAAKAGLQVGDLILEVDGMGMANWNHLLQNGIPGQPETVLVLSIVRDGKDLKISLTRALP
jgi:hypothetical protein